MSHLSMQTCKIAAFRCFAFCLCFTFYFNLKAQVPEANQLVFHIEGLKTPRANLNYYYGEQAFRADSAMVDTATGTMRFSSKNRHAGLYFLSIKGGRLFDFILDKPGISFTVKTSMMRLDSLQAEGSPENAAFFQYKYAEAALKTKIEQTQANLQLIAQATKNDSSAMGDLNKRLNGYQEELVALPKQFMQAHPDFLFAKLLRLLQRPTPPTQLTAQVKGDAPNPKLYAWWQQHYWDGSDFNDDRLVYNNLWVNALNVYISRIVTPQPDSLNHAIDALLAKMPKDGAFYQFTVKHLVQRFEQNDWANADQVFVHLADTYQKVNATSWLDQATLLRIEEKANSHRRNLTGQPAPPLSLPDLTGQAWDLTQLKTPYSLLIFTVRYARIAAKPCRACTRPGRTFPPKVWVPWLSVWKTMIFGKNTSPNKVGPGKMWPTRLEKMISKKTTTPGICRLFICWIKTTTYCASASERRIWWKYCAGIWDTSRRSMNDEL